MGRRALRKIDPAIDLTGHLKTVEQLPRPCTAETLFGRAAALEVEVGSGKGLFLRNAAAPGRKPVFSASKWPRNTPNSRPPAGKAGLTNAMMVNGDGLRVFQELIPDGSLAAVHVYFPDPWWKKRHRRRRVMRESFLRDIERTLRPGGSLHFWTDVEEYFQTSLALLASQTTLLGPLPVPETPAEHDMAYRTHFERRVRLASETVYRAEFRKGIGAA